MRRKKICRLLVKKGCDYIFSIKNNQKANRREIALQMELKAMDAAKSLHSICKKEHGCITLIDTSVIEVPDHLKRWDGVKQLVKIERTRIYPNNTQHEIAYAITSLSPSIADAKRIGELVRTHWSIENHLHRARDCNLKEDASTIRSGSAPQVMASLRSLLIQLIKKLSLSVADAIFDAGRYINRAIKWICEN